MIAMNKLSRQPSKKNIVTKTATIFFLIQLGVHYSGEGIDRPKLSQSPIVWKAICKLFPILWLPIYCSRPRLLPPFSQLFQNLHLYLCLCLLLHLTPLPPGLLLLLPQQHFTPHRCYSKLVVLPLRLPLLPFLLLQSSTRQSRLFTTNFVYTLLMALILCCVRFSSCGYFTMRIPFI